MWAAAWPGPQALAAGMCSHQVLEPHSLRDWHVAVHLRLIQQQHPAGGGAASALMSGQPVCSL